MSTVSPKGSPPTCALRVDGSARRRRLVRTTPRTPVGCGCGGGGGPPPCPSITGSALMSPLSARYRAEDQPFCPLTVIWIQALSPVRPVAGKDCPRPMVVRTLSPTVGAERTFSREVLTVAVIPLGAAGGGADGTAPPVGARTGFCAAGGVHVRNRYAFCDTSRY